VTRDLRGSGYRAFSYNTLGTLVEYDGAWESETRLVFTALRTAPGRGARVLYEKRPDGTVLFASEAQRPDGGFARYFWRTDQALKGLRTASHSEPGRPRRRWRGLAAEPS
jgi:hypothetical protein